MIPHPIRCLSYSTLQHPSGLQFYGPREMIPAEVYPRNSRSDDWDLRYCRQQLTGSHKILDLSNNKSDAHVSLD
jgi:hypothetical protein